jgi:hypothetical protein
MTLGKTHGWLLLALLTWTVTIGMFGMPDHAMDAYSQRAFSGLKASDQMKAPGKSMACDTPVQGMVTADCDPAPQPGSASCCLPSSCPALMMVGPASIQVAALRAGEPSFFSSSAFPESPSDRLYRPPRHASV